MKSTHPRLPGKPTERSKNKCADRAAANQWSKTGTTRTLSRQTESSVSSPTHRAIMPDTAIMQHKWESVRKSSIKRVPQQRYEDRTDRQGQKKHAKSCGFGILCLETRKRSIEQPTCAHGVQRSVTMRETCCVQETQLAKQIVQSTLKQPTKNGAQILLLKAERRTVALKKGPNIAENSKCVERHNRPRPTAAGILKCNSKKCSCGEEQFHERAMKTNSVESKKSAADQNRTKHCSIDWHAVGPIAKWHVWDIAVAAFGPKRASMAGQVYCETTVPAKSSSNGFSNRRGLQKNESGMKFQTRTDGMRFGAIMSPQLSPAERVPC